MDPGFRQKLISLDAELLQLVKPVNVLKYLNWPDYVEESFLDQWNAGRPELPQVELQVPDWRDLVVSLDDFISRCEGDDPLVQFLRSTAWSYAEAARMLMAAGTAQFTERSINLYGRPDDLYQTQTFTGLDAATFLLEKTDHLLKAQHLSSAEANVAAPLFAERLQKAVDDYFTDDKVSIVVDDELSSKAIAGTSRIRIRGSALFSELDFDQLYHHEALVHSATAINGKRQTSMKCLSLSAPRTTRTQEGIAVFAELVTRSIDINRLRRLALRVKSLDQVINGADFIDCFKMFLEGGQTEREAFKSAQRIFRGGDVRGDVAFTKDSAYLKGLMEVHVLMNVAIRDNQPQVIQWLFAGRLATGDAISLQPYFDNGFLDPPKYVPPWARDTSRLAASLAYSSFMMNVNLSAVSLDSFVDATRRSDFSGED
ncbi:flavohemoglobin expression-modulating QEGLA motif protein [Thalassoglobus sp. JC818]|uniref:flavohemoglobin expression-modulating QEGLA motif protein n=1 Tax=Thalassoglobus sp. JC818 TaxID=3232136 RepID=UPI00345ABC23